MCIINIISLVFYNYHKIFHASNVLNSEHFDAKYIYIQDIYMQPYRISTTSVKSGANRLDIPGVNVFWCKSSGYQWNCSIINIH